MVAWYFTTTKGCAENGYEKGLDPPLFSVLKLRKPNLHSQCVNNVYALSYWHTLAVIYLTINFSRINLNLFSKTPIEHADTT